MKTYVVFEQKRSKRSRYMTTKSPQARFSGSWEDADTVYLGRRASARTLAPLGRRRAAMTASGHFRLPCQPPRPPMLRLLTRCTDFLYAGMHKRRLYKTAFG